MTKSYIACPRALARLPGIGMILSLAILAARPADANTIVRFDTNLGSFDVELFDSVVPTTVNNFLNYVTSGRYDGTLVHRSTAVPDSGFGVIQGGGYTPTGFPTNHIPTFAPIPLEYQLPNARGTIGMARMISPHTATSQWFINTTDNSTILGPQNSGGYAVFGQVLGDGMDVVDAINTLPKASLFPHANIPYLPPGPLNVPTNGVVVNSVTIVPEPVALTPAGSALVAFLFLARRRRRAAVQGAN